MRDFLQISCKTLQKGCGLVLGFFLFFGGHFFFLVCGLCACFGGDFVVFLCWCVGACKDCIAGVDLVVVVVVVVVVLVVVYQ